MHEKMKVELKISENPYLEDCNTAHSITRGTYMTMDHREKHTHIVDLHSMGQ